MLAGVLGFSTLGFYTQISLVTDVKGILPIANGGTGLASVGSTGYVFTSDGSGGVWSPPSGGGGSISLLTEGVANGSQAILNQACVGCSYADNGTGTVTLTVSGVGQVSNNNVGLTTSSIPANSCTTATNVTSGLGSATADSSTTASFRTDPTGVTGWGDYSITLRIYQGSARFSYRVCNNTTGAISPGSMSVNFRTSL